MAITTLLAYWTGQKTQADAALKAALTVLTTAQNDLATQRSKLSTANQQLADLVKATAQIRADLAQAVTPADVDALESKLAKAIRDTRVKQAEIIGIEAAIDTAQTALDLATANVASATARGSAVAAALETADQQDKDRVQVGTGQAVRASNSVTISGLTGHPFIVNDVITVMAMTNASFNGTFTIGAVTDTSITYPQTQVAVGSGQAVRASNSVTISGLTDHAFTVNDVITVIGMTDASFNGTFTIGAVTGNTVTYPQTQADATSGDGVIQAADATSGSGVIFGKRALRLRHKLATPPLSTMVADATAALAAKPWTDAKARIEADIPQELRDCAKERANVELKRLENDNKKVTDTAKLLSAVIADADNRRQLFDNADAAFRDYVVNAKGRFDQALAIAARVADPKQNPLTEAQDLSIHSKNPDGALDAALQTNRNAAAAARKEVATKQIDVDAKETDLDIARLDAKAKDIDGNPETDPAVTAAKAALATAQTDLASANTAFTSDMQTDLADWETAVPDTAWRNLADFEEAKRLLIGLETDPAPLVTAMDNAEADLVAALIAAEKAGRTLGLLESEALKGASKARFDKGTLPRRTLSALRGDS